MTDRTTLHGLNFDEAQYDVLRHWFEDHTRDDPVYKQDWMTFTASIETWAARYYPNDAKTATSMVWLWRPIIDHQRAMYEAHLNLFDRTMRFLHSLRTERNGE